MPRVWISPVMCMSAFPKTYNVEPSMETHRPILFSPRIAQMVPIPNDGGGVCQVGGRC